jgi:probable F420-dependent oxidoreductase
MAELLHYTALAEEAGAESLWTTELLRDAFVPLTAMASVTKTARLGTAVAQFARPPMHTEMSAMSLAEYTQGRFTLGLGTAPPKWNENWHGLTYRKPVTRMREYIECIRTMWTATPTEAVSYIGEYVQVKDYPRAMPAPYPDVPIYLGAVLPNMIQLAASHTSGLITNALSSRRYFTDVIHPNLKRGQAARTLPSQDFEFCGAKICAVNKDRKRAREIARVDIAFFSELPYFDIVLDPLGFTEAKLAIRAAAQRQDLPGMVQAVTEDMIDALVLAGTPDEVHRQLEPYAELFDTLILYAPSFGTDAEETKATHDALLVAFAG